MSKSKNRPIIGITMGDPQGIGPEVTLKALRSMRVRRICRPIVFGDTALFDFRKARQLTPRQCGRLAAFYIKQAAHAAMTRQIDAVVTAPIAKGRLHRAGYQFPGHTEFLQALTRTRRVRMMMAGPTLRVALVTIHEPLRRVPRLLTAQKILETLEITDQALKKWWGRRRPRIAVAGLNPHAGESGAFGREEKTTLGPAIRRARRRGICVEGPFPPDTVFLRAVQGEFDAVVAMYHDQGLIPLKLLDFDRAVNVTLGLPIVRTSPDHGTAFDIAGKGVANPTSMIAAIEMAAALTRPHPA